MRARTRFSITATAVAAVAVLSLIAYSFLDSEQVKPSDKETKSSGIPTTANTDTSTPRDVKRDVKITKSGIENHKTWGPDAYVVHYTITNNGESSADYFAQFEFFDKDGDVLGSTGVTAEKLGSGKSKEGDTSPLEPEIENGKMSDIASVRVSHVNRI